MASIPGFHEFSEIKRGPINPIFDCAGLPDTETTADLENVVNLLETKASVFASKDLFVRDVQVDIGKFTVNLVEKGGWRQKALDKMSGPS